MAVSRFVRLCELGVLIDAGFQISREALFASQCFSYDWSKFDLNTPNAVDHLRTAVGCW